MASLVQKPMVFRFALSRSFQCCCRPSPSPSQLRIPRRFFSQSSLLAAKKPHKPVTRRVPPNALAPKAATRTPSQPLPKSASLAQTIPPATASTTQNYKSFAATLASKSSPTLLYESPFPLIHTTVSYLFGGFCIAYGSWNIYAQVLHPLQDMGPIGTSFWVAIAAAMGFLGLWSISGVGCLFLHQYIGSCQLSICFQTNTCHRPTEWSIP